MRKKVVKKTKKRQKQKNRLLPKQNQLLEQYAVTIGEIIPASSPLGKGICFKNIAKEKGLIRYWSEKTNKRKTLSHFFKNVYRYKPVVFRKIIRENISEGIERRKRRGNPVLEDEMDIISQILIDLDIDMRSELKGLNLPAERPLIVPPPPEYQNMINKIGLDIFFDECKKKYIDGYFKDSVRLAFEKIEKLVMDLISSKELGKKLMANAFDESSPQIKINSPVLSNWSARQEGIKFITMGSTLFIRNPFSHGDEPEPPHNEAFELLCLANHIYRVIKNRVV
jgi:hypothetical protein